jgi:enoyl-CoA hydratase
MYQLDRAIEAGLMDQVVDAETLMETALTKAAELATMGHPSYTLTKNLLIEDVLNKIDKSIEGIESIKS